MTDHEWAEVRAQIAEARAGTIQLCAGLSSIAAMLAMSFRWPDFWWLWLPAMYVVPQIVAKPHVQAAEKARKRADSLYNAFADTGP